MTRHTSFRTLAFLVLLTATITSASTGERGKAMAIEQSTADDTAGLLRLCQSNDLTTTAGWQGATGSLAGSVSMTNVSSERCALSGYPDQVRIVDAQDNDIVSTTEYFNEDSTPWIVVIGQGQHASVGFRWANYCGPEHPGPFTVVLTLPDGGGQLAAVATDPADNPQGNTPRCNAPDDATVLSFASFDSTDATNEQFDATWRRTDLPVKEHQADRTWVWGPQPYTSTLDEPYAEAPGGNRLVQYFDKSRMEINDPTRTADDLWSVTNGLLVVEMVDGEIQTGDATFDEAPEPADIPIAGDPDSDSITYAQINTFGLRDAPPSPVEQDMITERIAQDGTVTNDKSLSSFGITTGPLISETNHRVASVFWEFLHSTALVFDGGYVDDHLFQDWFYASGLPITEAYWSTVELDGDATDVLWQCFERRCLTYTPSNPDGWQVEAGNVGLHYFRWRYPEVDN